MEDLKNELKEVMKEIINAVRLSAAVVEMDYPGKGRLVYDVVAEEIDKLRSKTESAENQ